MGFNSSYSRMVLVGVVLLAVGALPLLKWRTFVTLALYAGLLVSAMLFWLPSTSRGHFLDDLYSIKPGMTVPQVKQKMRKYEVRGQGKASRSSWPANREGDESYIAYGHSHASEYNADVGAVVFRRGKVAYVDFSPD